MKKIILFITVSVMVLVLASLIVYRFVDINNYKTDIVALVKEKTGREITINGDIRLRILPDIALDISDLAVQSGQSGYTENIVSISHAIIHLRIMPLLKREIEVSRLKLVSPVVKFNVFKDGRNNFTQNGINEISAEEVKNTNLHGNFEKNYTLVRDFINTNIVDQFNLSSLDIEDAKFRFTDERSNVDISLDNVNAQTSFVPGNNQLKISGQLNLGTGINKPFSIGGQYELIKDFYEFSTLVVKFGDIETHGEAGVDFRGNVPDVKIAFYFENMDLNPYSGFIDPILVSNTPVLAKPEKLGNVPYKWSVEPIDFAVLRGFNGHFSFKSNNILYKDNNIGSVTMNSYLRNGKFTLSVKEAELLGGNINGELVVDATSSVTKIRNKINLEEVDLTKLPPGFGALSNIGGRLSGGVMLVSRGVSKDDFANNVDGSISLRIDDGVINGLDLIGIAKNINSAFTIGKPDQKTIFKELAGDFDVRDGTVKTDNLTFGSDLLDCNGHGSVNLPELTIDLKIIPKVKRAKDEADALGSMRAPILVSGSLLQPTFRLEVQSLVEDLIKNPNGTENLVRQIKRDFDGIKDDMKNDNDGVVKDIKNIFSGF